MIPFVKYLKKWNYNEQKHRCLFGAEEAEMGKEVRLQKGQEQSFGTNGHIHRVGLWKGFWDVKWKWKCESHSAVSDSVQPLGL